MPSLPGAPEERGASVDCGRDALSAIPLSRLNALREATARVSREKRLRELVPGTEGALAGRYKGTNRTFALVWVAEECGYVRRFQRERAWAWGDPTVYATSAVESYTSAALWVALDP